ncbi:MAG TPA: hypothetical protein VHB25_15055 [Gemmatimonadaceae bacterium]|nr:hypothetical protein [Gemmatimonadaceae bacterium]
MLTTRRPARSIPFRPSTAELEARFPRAVAGEDYDRYARAVWPQAQRWVDRHWDRVVSFDYSVDEVRDVLHQIAAIDLARRLYPQEERLLAEIVRHCWLTKRSEPLRNVS